jgi:fibronectin type 3 domain-containing protein
MQPATSFADSTVQSGTSYYYVVTSVGTDAVESPYSTQVTAVVPSP